jgi:hypothetical protein
LLGIDTYFFCSRNTRNATIFFTERLRERESPHIEKNRACSCSQEEEEEEDVHQVRFVVGPFFVITSVFVEGELFPESSSQMFQPWGLTTTDAKLCYSSSTHMSASCIGVL